MFFTWFTCFSLSEVSWLHRLLMQLMWQSQQVSNLIRLMHIFHLCVTLHLCMYKYSCKFRLVQSCSLALLLSFMKHNKPWKRCCKLTVNRNFHHSFSAFHPSKLCFFNYHKYLPFITSVWYVLVPDSNFSSKEPQHTRSGQVVQFKPKFPKEMGAPARTNKRESRPQTSYAVGRWIWVALLN